MMSHNGTRSTSLRTSILGKPPMSWLTVYVLLLNDATSQPMRRKMTYSIQVCLCANWFTSCQEATCTWPHCNNCKNAQEYAMPILPFVNNLNAMVLTSSGSVSEVQKQCPLQSIPWQPPTTGAAQHSSGNCTKSHIPGRASCPARTPSANVVDVRTTGSPDGIIVEPSNIKWQSLKGDLQYTVVSDEAENKKTKNKGYTVAVGMTITPSDMKLVLLDWHSVDPHLPNGQTLINTVWETLSPLPSEMPT